MKKQKIKRMNYTDIISLGICIEVVREILEVPEIKMCFIHGNSKKGHEKEILEQLQAEYKGLDEL